MVIIFYGDNDKIYICTEHDKTQIVDRNDPNLLQYIPDEDIVYVQNAHYVTKSQFSDWLNGKMKLSSEAFETNTNNRFAGFMNDVISSPQPTSNIRTQNNNRMYIHPTHNGSITITDIKTPAFPEGVSFNGKWHFIPVDQIGEDILMESNMFKIALNKGKIAVVPESYVQANKHKMSQKVSPAQMALDSILVPADMKAEAVARAGSIGNIRPASDEAIEIFVDS